MFNILHSPPSVGLKGSLPRSRHPTCFDKTNLVTNGFCSLFEKMSAIWSFVGTYTQFLRPIVDVLTCLLELDVYYTCFVCLLNPAFDAARMAPRISQSPETIPSANRFHVEFPSSRLRVHSAPDDDGVIDFCDSSFQAIGDPLNSRR